MSSLIHSLQVEVKAAELHIQVAPGRNAKRRLLVAKTALTAELNRQHESAKAAKQRGASAPAAAAAVKTAKK